MHLKDTLSVELIGHTDLDVAITAMRKCWASEDKTDTCWRIQNDQVVMILGDNDRRLIQRIIESDHTSTVEHIVYNFEIKDISRAILQELARHRIASLSVQSTRYALKKLLNGEVELESLLVPSGNDHIDRLNIEMLYRLRSVARNFDLPNDIAKYGIPEAFKTTLIWTANARSLRNFLKLRSSKRAHPEIRRLAHAVYGALPEDHRLIFDGCMN
jgi:thymidylate synthase (FAD)